MNIAILGYGIQGRSAYEYWSQPSNTITICDEHQPEDIPDGVQTRIGPNYLDNLEEFDIIVRTPRLHPRDILRFNELHPEVMDRVTSVTNEFFRICPAPIIGITGTKGKGTTSSLIAAILAKAGKRVHLGGNIGVAPLDLLKNNIQPDDFVVLELANFQLIDLQYSPHIGVSLMMAPEHLDWHKDMYEYIKSKQQMFAHQQIHDIAIFNANNLYSEEVADVSPGVKLTYQVPEIGTEPDIFDGAYVKGSHIYMFDKKICSISDVALPGRHNLENVCAAITATWELVGHNKRVIKSVLRTFAGLPHRIQYLGQVNKIHYYNDSFASNPSATMAALSAIKHPKVMIIGGVDRKIDYSEFVNALIAHQKDIRKILLIGEIKGKLADGLQQFGAKNYSVLDVQTMPEIVAAAQAQAKKGDAIVLSPGAPSFDMFKNFEDRGNQFIACVQGQ